MVDVSSLFPFSEEVGYLSLFIVSFVGSAVVFIPVPFFFILVTMSIDPKFNPHILALISAIGATAGKMVIFYGSYYGRRILTDKTKQRMLPLQRLVSRYGWVAAFIAAATPIPDDLVYIPLGLSKYNPMRFLVATLAGKVLLSEVIAVLANVVGLSLLLPYLENIPDITTFYIYLGIFGAVLTLVIIYMLRIDWGKYVGKWFPWTVRDDEESNGDKGNGDDDNRNDKC
ncbi:MAG: VTT domain-containing protein [Nitrososphaerales archaeon]